ncbi:hypothetical protein [Kitasatospora terrestris]
MIASRRYEIALGSVGGEGAPVAYEGPEDVEAASGGELALKR